MLLYKQAAGEQNRPEDRKQTSGYFSILATLALLLVLLFLIFPAIRHITTVNKEISDARVVKASLENKVEALKEAADNLDAARADLPILDIALPIGSDITSYIKNIEGLAGKYNLKISAVQFSNVPLSKPKSKDSLKTKKLSGTFTLEGNFLEFQKFLIDLENYIRTSDVSLVSIRKEPDGTLAETLNVTGYYLGEESLPTNESSGAPAATEAP